MNISHKSHCRSHQQLPCDCGAKRAAEIKKVEVLEKQVRALLPEGWHATRAFDAFSNAPEFISVSRPFGYYKGMDKDQKAAARMLTRAEVPNIAAIIRAALPNRVVEDSDCLEVKQIL